MTETEEKDLPFYDEDRENRRGKITEITVVEIPFQNFLKPREIMQQSLIWLDSNLDNFENQYYMEKIT